jgi:hypothetical protein
LSNSIKANKETPMNRLAAILLLAFTFSLTAHADDASHRAKAQEMMAILHSQQMVENIAEGLKKQFPEAANDIIGANPSPEKKTHAADFVKHADQMIDTQLSWTALQSAFTDIYVKNFTEEQLDAIIAFYKTPAGLALLTTMPTINNQVAEYGNQRITDLKPQLKQIYDDFKKSDGAAPSIGPAGMGSLPPAAPSTPAPRKAGAPK